MVRVSLMLKNKVFSGFIPSPACGGRVRVGEFVGTKLGYPQPFCRRRQNGLRAKNNGFFVIARSEVTWQSPTDLQSI
jgi:hypothetical protein